MVEHFFGFHCSPISSIADLVDFSTVFNLLSEAAKIFKSSMYNRSVTLVLIGLDNVYPSVALTFRAMGFKHRVNSLGHKASPWGRPLLNFIISDFSRPRLVVVTTLVFQLVLRLCMTPTIYSGNLCTCIISISHSWSTESYAFFMSIQAMLRFLLPL